MSGSELLDFRELERELAAAVAADQKYKRENDAKFRAINQKVSSYEEFRDIVLASNLKPLERKDKTGGERKQPWNPAVVTGSQSSELESVLLQESLAEPTNAFEFTRDWRRQGVEKKYDYLLRLGAEKLSQLFHAEVCSGLLGEFLIVLEENFQDTHREEVLKLLHCLAETKRFDLNLVFLSKDEHECSQKLFLKLQTCASAEAEEDGKEAGTTNDTLLKTLITLYRINERKL
ncbi:dynein axonemal assembly factor 19 [Rhinophrynus dorsalis]